MFSWGKSSQGSGGSNNNYPRTSGNATLTRSRHIESYVRHPTLGRSTRAVKHNEGTFDTVFQTRNHNTLIVRVHLSAGGSNLPVNKAPSMTLVGCDGVSHPWIDAATNRVVGYSAIATDAAWTEAVARHFLTLGDAVNNVVRHLQLNPPVVARITDPNLLKMQPPKPETNDTTTNNNEPPPPAYGTVSNDDEDENEQSFLDDLPFDFTIPASFPTLETMSLVEMDHLLQHQSDFEEFAKILPSRAAALEFRNSFTDANAQLAANTLAHEEAVVALEEELRVAVASCLERKTEHLELRRQLAERTTPPDARTLRRALAKEKRRLLDESDELANAWVDGDDEANVDDFATDFLRRRTILHELSAKAELLEAASAI